MSTAADTVTREVELILLLGIAEMRGYPLIQGEPPCSLCGCALPAAEPGECGRVECPLEGAGRP